MARLRAVLSAVTVDLWPVWALVAIIIFALGGK